MSATTTPVREVGRPGLFGLSVTTAAYLAASGVAIGTYFLLSGSVQQVAFEVIGSGAALAAIVGVSRADQGTRLPWAFIAFGLVCQVLGDWLDTWTELVDHREVLSPSLIDVVYISGYCAWIAGLLIGVYRMRVVRQLAALLDVLVFLVAFSTVQWMVVLESVRHQGYAFGETAVDMTYPSLDVILLVLVLQLTVRPTRHATRVRLLTVAVIAMVAADEFYFVAPTYSADSWVNALWLISYVFFGAVGLQPPTTMGADGAPSPAIRRIRVILLAAALMLTPVTLLGEFVFRHGHQHALAAAVGMTLVAGFVFARLWLLLRESEHQNRELRELDFLKDEFVASVSHELRTPLTSIAGYTELLEEDGGLVPATSGYGHLEVIRRSTNRLLGVVDDLLFAASVQRGSLVLSSAPVDLGEIVHLAVEAARPAADGKNIVIASRIESNVAIPADPDRLGQVVDNLVANAVKFTPAGGAR